MSHALGYDDRCMVGCVFLNWGLDILNDRVCASLSLMKHVVLFVVSCVKFAIFHH